jgi:septal ring factor EnvC (AmiA/AmiB activator)
MADKDDVLALLRIADLAKQWPNLQPLHDHAMDALVRIAAEHKEQAEKARAEAAKEAAAKKASAEADKEKKEASAKAPAKKDEDEDEGPPTRPISPPTGGYRRG